MHMLLLMADAAGPLMGREGWWACVSRAFVCVYYDMMLEVEGKLSSGKVRSGRSGKVCMVGTSMYCCEVPCAIYRSTTVFLGDRRVCRRCMSLATL